MSDLPAFVATSLILSSKNMPLELGHLITGKKIIYETGSEAGSDILGVGCGGVESGEGAPGDASGFSYLALQGSAPIYYSIEDLVWLPPSTASLPLPTL